MVELHAKNIALVSASELSHPDSDLPPLVSALQQLNVNAEVVAWDDDIAWSSYDAAIIRSTWDYHRRREEFDHWLTEVSQQTQLWNPPELIRWNSDKRYLADVAAKGLPVVPTAVIDRNELMSQRQLAEIGSDIVVKPSVGAGSHGVRRFTEQHEAALNYLRALIESGETPLIQPYLTNIDTRGEVGLVTAAGVLSHSFHKEAILNGDVQWSSDGHVLEVISAHTPSESELALCDRVLALLPETAYARIDMLPTDDGPVISEIELIEPSLFLEADTAAAHRIAAAFASLVRR
ncbi:MAG: ATP-grasp domain-containing protein [Ilumatobacteraceae bacterium]